MQEEFETWLVMFSVNQDEKTRQSCEKISRLWPPITAPQGHAGVVKLSPGPVGVGLKNVQIVCCVGYRLEVLPSIGSSTLSTKEVCLTYPSGVGQRCGRASRSSPLSINTFSDYKRHYRR